MDYLAQERLRLETRMRSDLLLSLWRATTQDYIAEG
jgi:hypothetical protein